MRRLESVDAEHCARCSRCGGCRHQTHELGTGDPDAACLRLLFDSRDDLVQRGSLVVLDVHAHLRVSRTWERKTKRADAGEAAVALPDNAGDLARGPNIVARQVHVERNERAARTDDDTAGTLVQVPRPVIRFDLARVDASLQLVGSPLSKERRATARRQVAVEEHRQLELVADTLRDALGDRACPIRVLAANRNDRNDVGRADSWMCTIVRAEIDAFTRARDRANKSIGKRLVVCHQGEDGAVVVGIGVHVEQPRVRSDGIGERPQRFGVAALRKVRNRFERKAHVHTLGGVKTYYERRAHEYDDWWLGRGLYADRDRPGWDEELNALRDVITALPPVRTLDVACGTGFLTRHLQGDVVALDASASMLDVARQQAPKARFVQGDALSLPFPDGSFDRLFTSYFYCHLEAADRRTFLAEARRVASELVVVGSRWKAGSEPERWEERRLKDGSVWTVYKRVFVAHELADELGGGEVLHEGDWFVVVRG